MSITSSDSRCVLIGDHEQLAPCLGSQVRDRDLEISMMQRLWGISEVDRMVLGTQFRSGPELFRFSNEMFYQGLIQSNST